MANYCIFCGEEIPEDQAICGVCKVILDNLPPDRQKKLLKVIENEEARAQLRAGLQEIKMQIRIALEPVVVAIIDFIDTVLAVTEATED